MYDGQVFNLQTIDRSLGKLDFSKSQVRQKIRERLHKYKPLYVIGFPSHNADSNDIQSKNHNRFCCELYQKQIENGRYYIHQHSENTTSKFLD